MDSLKCRQGKRLVLALEQDAGIDQLHACGGNARCTTCRIEFVQGEPDSMTVAERDVLKARGLSGIRLSCQIACDQDMTVRGAAHQNNLEFSARVLATLGVGCQELAKVLGKVSRPHHSERWGVR